MSIRVTRQSARQLTLTRTRAVEAFPLARPAATGKNRLGPKRTVRFDEASLANAAAESLARANARAAAISSQPSAAAHWGLRPDVPVSDPFDVTLAHGLLEITGSVEGPKGSVLHQATYSPEPGKNLFAPGFNDFRPTHPDLSQQELAGLRDYMQECGYDGLAPVSVMPTPSGEWMVSDGHHRFAAAVITGTPVPLLIDVRAESSQTLGPDWSGMSFTHPAAIDPTSTR